MIEDFRTWTEVDSAGDITRTAPSVSWDTMRRDADSWVVKDYKAGFFGDFEIQFTLQFSNIEAGNISSRDICVIGALSNTVGNFADMFLDDVLLILPLQNGSTDDVFDFKCRQFTGGVQDWQAIDTTDRGLVPYYLTWKRVGATVTLQIYSDSDRLILLDTITENAADQTAYRYIVVLASYNPVGGDPGDYSSGVISDLEVISPDTSGEENLGGEFTARHPASAELYAHAVIRHPASVELYSKVCVVPPRVQNFNTFTEQEEIDDIQHTCIHVDFIDRRNRTTYLWKDYGAAYFTDFVHYLDVTRQSHGSSAWCALWMLSNALKGEQIMRDDHDPYIAVIVGGSNPNLNIGEYDAGGNPFTGASKQMTLTTKYYARIEKNGTDFRLDVYSTALKREAGGEGDWHSTSITLQADYSMRYQYVGQTHDDSTAPIGSADMDNLQHDPILDVSKELYAHFIVRNIASAELYALFEVAFAVISGSAEAYAHAIIRNIGSAEVYGTVEVRHPASAELYATAEIRQSTSIEVYGHVEIRQSASAEVYGTVEVRHPASAELYASFEAQVSLNLYAHAEIRQPASADLYDSVEAQVSLNLYAHAEIRQPASAELYAHVVIQDTAELYAFFTVPDTYSITGITKDTAGNRLGSCEVALFATEPGNPPTYVFIAAGISDGNGDYTFAGLTKRKHFVRAQKDGSPSVFDTTDNELVAV